MSANHHDTRADGGAAGAAHGAAAQAPRLTGASGYQAWRTNIVVHLIRAGVGVAHSTVWTRADFTLQQSAVVGWGADAHAEAVALALPGSASASAATTAIPEAVRKARDSIAAAVGRSERAYASLISALTEDLRAQQSSTVAVGHAYGLWTWLETKFRSTEEDNVGDMLAEWCALRQRDGEAFDSYRARVNEKRDLLVTAKEPPSARMYAHTILDRLVPSFGPAVLALKSSDRVRDAATIDWDAVATMLNAHERQARRLDGGASDGPAIAAAATRWPKPNARGGAAKQTQASKRFDSDACFNCGKRDHFSKDCPQPPTPATLAARAKNAERYAGGPGDPSAGSYQPGARRDGDREHARMAAQRNPGRGGSSSEGEDLDAGTPAHRTGKSQGTWSAIAMRAGSEDPSKPTGTRSLASVSFRPNFASSAPASSKPRTQLAMPASLVTKRTIPPRTDASSTPASSTRAPAAAAASSSNRFAPLAAPAAAAAKANPPAAASSSPAPKAPAVAPPAAASSSAASGHRPEPRRPAPVPQAVAPVPRRSAVVAADPDKAIAGTSWGIDSMASVHISGNRELFTVLKKCSPMTIKMADLGVITVTQYGTVKVRVETTAGRSLHFNMDNVYYHERFSANLLSVGILTRSLKWEFHVTQAECYLLTPGGNRLNLGMRGRVSVMHPEDTERVYSMQAMESANVAALVRLHEKLGHLAFDRMVALLKGNAVADLSKLQATDHELQEARDRIHSCRGCLEGKGTRAPLGHRGLYRGSAPGEVLHMDTYQVQIEQDGAQRLEYGLTVSCAYSGFRWFARLVTKDRVADAVIAIVRQARTQLGCRVRRLHSDGGTEFINATLKEFCRADGIMLEWSPARTQALNGVAESAVRAEKNATRTLIAHARAPLRFWFYAAEHATFLWNRTHVNKRTHVTPYELLLKRAPSSRHWGVFGCDVVVHIPKEKRGALAPTVEPGIYLGHHHEQNCARVYILRTRKVISTRDVTYRNGSFEYGQLLLRNDSSVIDDVLAQVAAGGAAPLDLDAENDEPAHSQPPARSRSTRDADADETRYDIEAIVGRQLRSTRIGEELQVKWVGYDEPTWEPAAAIEADAPDAVRDFRASCPAPSVRRSARLQADSTDERGPDAGAPDADPHTDGQVNMVMAALRGMHLDDTRVVDPTSAETVYAVATGTALLEDSTPVTYRAAVTGPNAPKWVASMGVEIAACWALGVFSRAPRASLPKGTKVLSCKWVFKTKLDASGAVASFKSRITPRGCGQDASTYGEVFARTGQYKTLRFGLSLTARFDHELEQLDIPTAFLNADVEEEVYMEIPEGQPGAGRGSEYVYRLHKALYGLKQSPRNWYLLVSEFITGTMGFTACVSDPCLYFRRSRTGRLILLYLFVDDFQGSFHAEDRAEWGEMKRALSVRFKAKDLGESQWILGMRISRDRVAKTITLDQELYVTKALEKYGFAECKSAPTPEVVGAAHAEPTAEQAKPADRQRYMEITGSLMYAAISTRLDIAHAVHYLASHMLAPTGQHMAAAERVLRYLAGTRQAGLVFGSRNGGVAGDSRGHAKLDVDVCAYADADWANNRGDRRSITGWVGKLNGDPISWASKKQRTVALSTCEAELYAEAAAIQEVLWLRGLVKELGLHTHLGSTVYGDNQSAIAVSKNGVKGERTKHVDVKYHFVTETVEAGTVRLVWIPTLQQQADIFTKALAEPNFVRLRKLLMSE